LLRAMPALLTSTSTPAPGQRLAMMRGSATTSASWPPRRPRVGSPNPSWFVAAPRS